MKTKIFALLLSLILLPYGMRAQDSDEGYTIDYKAETITIAEGYEVYTAASGGDKIESGGSITAYIGQKLYIQQTDASGRTAISIPARPQAPNGLNLMDWTDISVTYYVGKGVQCRLNNEGDWVTPEPDETDYTFTGLTPQTTYTIYARYPATDSQFASAEASDEITTKSSAADAPEVGAATVTNTTVTLPYNAAWEYQMGDGDWRSIQNPNVFTGLTAATQYTYHVRVAETQTAEASAIATVTVWTAYAAPADGEGYFIDYDARQMRAVRLPA